MNDDLQTSSFRITAGFIDRSQHTLWQGSLSGGQNRPVSEDEAGAEASCAWAKIDDRPLLQLDAERPPVLWGEGFPFQFVDASFGDEPVDQLLSGVSAVAEGCAEL